MARRWTVEEEQERRIELQSLYVEANGPIDEVGRLLKIAPQTVFDRLRRLGIPTCREKKEFVNNQRKDIVIPANRTKNLAELFGILLGDGHVDHFQVFVNLGNKELEYAHHVCRVMHRLFGKRPRISTRAAGHRDVYLGSAIITSWLYQEGLVRNKVQSQVDAPHWIYEDKAFIASFLRGFFDTDGSVYKLRFGIQVSFCNKSIPLLVSLQTMLRTLGYTPSRISGSNLYLTRRSDVKRFFAEIRPANPKHVRRYAEIIRRVGTQ